ncbi:MAG: hypothetical protein HYV35_02765 [Lentisphaerae bacterium]|nr:hypothetical protein [Lentisphaerota bacterium]
MNGRLILMAMVGSLCGGALTLAHEDADHSHQIRQIQKQEQERREHIKQQKLENAAFRESLKGMTPAERKAALAAHRQAQFEENKDFRQQQHEENLAFLKARLAKNSKLTDAQKEELINFFEEQYQESVDFRAAQHQENVAFFESIANDASLTMAQKKEAIRDHFKTQRAENKAFLQEQKSENQAERAKFKSEIDSSSETK